MADEMKPRIGLNQALALVALALGVLALAGNPHRGHRVTLDTQELAVMVGTAVDHVTPQTLAGWIIAGATDYRLIDLRSPAEFVQYHIPTAENVPLAGLPGYGLARNEKIVLYSQGGIHAAQAWLLLKAEDYAGAYILFGGLEGWQDEVLHPVAPAQPTPQEAAAFERSVQVARFFGGGPRAAGPADAAQAPEMIAAPAPSATAPPPPPTPVGTAKKKAKREGC
jgi:rhodanese-related sulfurtransferase